jgi:branched-chain amino acid transport system ATP-binding protein
VTALLNLGGMSAGYGVGWVVQDVSLSVPVGEVTVLLGANGAGKTSLMRGLSGVIARQGVIELDGQDISAWSPSRIVRAGLVHVPQGRGVLASLTVDENLRVAGSGRDRRAFRQSRDHVLSLFPRLGERGGQLAGGMSGGEQQMLAIGRAMIMQPRVLLLDEPSLGLAPIIRRQVFDTISAIAGQGIAVLLVEQNADISLAIAQRAALLSQGRIVAEGDAASIAASNVVVDTYLSPAGLKAEAPA